MVKKVTRTSCPSFVTRSLFRGIAGSLVSIVIRFALIDDYIVRNCTRLSFEKINSVKETYYLKDYCSEIYEQQTSLMLL